MTSCKLFIVCGTIGFRVNVQRPVGLVPERIIEPSWWKKSLGALVPDSLLRLKSASLPNAQVITNSLIQLYEFLHRIPN